MMFDPQAYGADQTLDAAGCSCECGCQGGAGGGAGGGSGSDVPQLPPTGIE